MASKLFNQIYKRYGKSKEDEEEKYINEYDDGSIWSKQSEETNTPLSKMYTSISPKYAPTKKQVEQEQIEDALQAPRNQIQYYTNKLGQLGVEPTEPSMLQKGIGVGLKTLEGVTLAPSMLDNAIAGAGKQYATNKIDTMKTKAKMEEDMYEKNDDSLLGKIGNALYRVSKFLNAFTPFNSDIMDAVASKNTLDNGGNVRAKTDDELQEAENRILSMPTEALKSAGGTVKGFLTNDYSDVASFSDLLPEDAPTWQKIGLDVGVGLITPGLEDTGKAFKYLKNADKADEALNSVNDIRKATNLARQSTSLDDYTKVLQNANPDIKFSADDIKEAYDNYIDSIAKQNIKESGKAIGAMNDFEGIKFGGKTILSRDALKRISDNGGMQKKITEIGLGAYSPVSAILNNKATSTLGKKIGETKIGSDIKDAFDSKFVNEYKSAMKKDPSKALEYGNAMITSAKNKKLFKESISSTIKEIQDYATQNNQSPEDITKAIENVKTEYTEIKTPKQVLNDAYVNEAYKKAEGDYYKLSSELKTKIDELTENIDKADGEDLKLLKNQRDSYANLVEKLDNANTKITTDFTSYAHSDELKDLGLNISKRKTSELMKDSLSLSTEDLKNKLVKDYGVLEEKAEDIAVSLRANSNKVMDNVNEMFGEDVSKYFTGIKTKRLDKSFKDAELSKRTILQDGKKGSIYEGVEYRKYRVAKAGMEARGLTEKHKQLRDNIDKLFANSNSDDGERIYNLAKKHAEEIKTSKDLVKWLKDDIGVDFKDLSKEEKELIKTSPAKYIKEQMDWLKDELKSNPILKEKAKLNQTDVKELFNQAKELGLDVEYDDFKKLVGKDSRVLERNAELDQAIMSNYMRKLDGASNEKLQAYYDYYGELISKNKKATQKKNEIASGVLTKEGVKKESLEDKRFINGNKVLEEPTDDTIKLKDFDTSGTDFDNKDVKSYTGTNVKDEMGINRTDYTSSERIASRMNDMLKNKAEQNRTPRYALNGASDDELRAYMTSVKTHNNLKLDVDNMSKTEMEHFLYKAYDSKRKYKFVQKSIKHDKETLNKVNNMLNNTKVKEAIQRNADLLDKFGIDMKNVPNWTQIDYENFTAVINARGNLNVIKELDKDLYTELSVISNNFKDVSPSFMKLLSDKAYEFKNGLTKVVDDIVEPVKKPNVVKNTLADLTDSELFNNKKELSELLENTKSVLEKENIRNQIYEINQELKLRKPINKSLRDTGVLDLEKTLSALEFNIPSGKLSVKEGIQNAKGITLDDLNGNNVILGESLDSSVQGMQKGKNVYVNMDSENARGVLLHETNHVMQELNLSADKKVELYNNLVNTMKELPTYKRSKLVKLINTEGVDSTTASNIMKGNLTNYIANTDINKQATETLATYASLINSNDPIVKKQVIGILGERNYTDFNDALGTLSDKKAREVVEFTRKTLGEEKAELTRKIINMDKVLTIDEQNATVKKLGEQVRDVRRIVDDVDKVFDLDERHTAFNKAREELVNYYESVSPEMAKQAEKTVGKYKEVYDIQYAMEKIQDFSDLTEEEMNTVNRYIERMKKIGLKEGILTQETADNYKDYVNHMLAGDVSKDYDLKEYLNKMGFDFKDPTNVYSKERKFKGTIEEINKEAERVIGKKIFEDNIYKMWLQREIKHNKYIYAKSTQDNLIGQFGHKIINNFDEEAINRNMTTDELIRETIDKLGIKVTDRGVFNEDLPKYSPDGIEYVYKTESEVIEMKKNKTYTQWQNKTREQGKIPAIMPDDHKEVIREINDYYDYIYSGKLSEDGYIFLEKNPLKKPENGANPLDAIDRAENSIEFSEMDLKNVNRENIKDMYIIKKDAWDIYKKEMERMHGKDKNGFLKAYDKFSSVFKAQAVTSVKFHLNNEIGNFFNSYVGAGVNLYNPKMIKVAHDLKTNKQGKIGKYSYDEIRAYLASSDMLTTQIDDVTKDVDYNSFIKSKVDKLGETEQISPLKKALGKINPLNTDNENGFIGYKLNYKLGESIETRAKLINFATHLKNGMNMGDAEMLTKKVLFDYNDLTDFESGVLKRIIPFYSFMSKNLGLQLENIQNRQNYLKPFSKLYQSSSKYNETDRDRALKPDYMEDYLPLGNQNYLNLRLPFFDIKTMFQPTDLASGLNPLIKSPIEMMLNKEFYSGNNISKYDKSEEKLKYGAKSLMPLAKNLEKFINLYKYKDPQNAEEQKRKDKAVKGVLSFLGNMRDSFDIETSEKQTMYKYVEELQNQYYELLEDNPGLKEYLEQLEKQKMLEKQAKKKSQSSYARFNKPTNLGKKFIN